MYNHYEKNSGFVSGKMETHSLSSRGANSALSGGSFHHSYTKQAANFSLMNALRAFGPAASPGITEKHSPNELAHSGRSSNS